MTVAAAILCPDAETALRPIDGRPLVRRVAEAAWSGGAVPVIVVAREPDVRIAEALAGASVIVASAGAGGLTSPLAQLEAALDAAREEVAGTSAILAWPVRMAWVDPESVTSLIEAHGAGPGRILRPAFGGQRGWPVLLPAERIADLGPAGDTDDLDLALAALDGSPGARVVDLGDPGAIHDLATPREALPPYEAPPGPMSGATYEWGAAGTDDPATTD
ncbi:MAG TPA: NTP transferase domain-containing protein [Candidatus Limnocylindrales bacterium]|jgi:CTP:molybdopterin cytidylyltransferase MocA|nr:NTP transferase domain-containing protein [Candidatus Limnocylindrales bacterium]